MDLCDSARRAGSLCDHLKRRPAALPYAMTAPATRAGQTAIKSTDAQRQRPLSHWGFPAVEAGVPNRLFGRLQAPPGLYSDGLVDLVRPSVTPTALLLFDLPPRVPGKPRRSVAVVNPRRRTPVAGPGTKLLCAARAGCAEGQTYDSQKHPAHHKSMEG
jgi:hypothetical protein